MNNTRYDILICNDDELSLPIHVCDSIQQASEWLGCNASLLYKNKHLYNKMVYNGYVIELVRKDDIK